VELGEGIHALCRVDSPQADSRDTADASPAKNAKADLSSLGSMLQARWKGGAAIATSKPESLRAGQILKFRIVKLDLAAKKIELELA
jgi:small subunit ribosomal protein S1